MTNVEIQFAAIEHIEKLVAKLKREGIDVEKEALWLIDKCRYGDVYGRISWKKLLYNVTTSQDIKFYYGLFN
jgi:hypothetical protein